MASPDRARLARLMADMADGDQAALFPFLDEFGDRLAGLVRRFLRDLHRPDVAADRHDVDYLVQSAAFVIFDRAGSWDPHGALPWTWAARGIKAEIVDFLGHPSVELHDTDLDRRDPTGGAPALTGAEADVDLDALGADVPLVELLVQGVREIASVRDAGVHLQYRIQSALGDPSPAHTVGAMFELRADNVRQIDLRVRRKLSALAASDPTFAALARVAWVEAC